MPKLIVLSLAIVLLLVATYNSKAQALTLLQSRYDQLSTSGTGALATHTIGFTYTNYTTPIGSVTIEFCSNTPLIGDVCDASPGLNLANASLAMSAETGQTGFSIYSITSNTITLTRSPTVPTAPDATSTYPITNIYNPTSPGTYYVRLETFASTDGSGSNIEQGGIAIAVLPAFTISSEVPPYLTFCSGTVIANLNCDDVSGDQINFGDFSPSNTSAATSQFLTATNANNGYSVTLDGTTMTSGNNIIPAPTTPTASRLASSQFGVNLLANTSPSVGSNPVGNGTASVSPTYDNRNLYLFNSGDVVASSNRPSDYMKFTVSYIVNVNSGQPVGVYATTVSYICLANF